MKFFNTKNGRIVKTVLAVVLAIATVAGAAALITTLANKKDDGLKKISPTFEVGGLTETGKYKETKLSIYTKDAFECNGLTITPDFDAKVNYQIFFYDETDNFLSSSEIYTEGAVVKVPFAALKARMVITPIWDAETEDKDKELNVFDALKYKSKLTIKVSEVQYSSIDVKQKSLYPSEVYNLVKGNLPVEYKLLGQGTYDGENNRFLPFDNSPWFVHEVSTKGCSNLVMKLSSSSIEGTVDFEDQVGRSKISFFDLGGTTELDFNVVAKNKDFAYISCDVSSISDILYFLVDSVSVNILDVYIF